ncbi:MAG: hypothetical protein ACLT78_10620 [Escherichia coli]
MSKEDEEEDDDDDEERQEAELLLRNVMVVGTTHRIPNLFAEGKSDMTRTV